MKKVFYVIGLTIMLLLLANTSIFARVTYRITIYDRAIGYEPYLHAEYTVPYPGQNPPDLNVPMKLVGPSGDYINGIMGRVFEYVDETFYNYNTYVNAYASYGSRRSSIVGPAFGDVTYIFPYIAIPDPVLTPIIKK